MLSGYEIEMMCCCESYVDVEAEFDNPITVGSNNEGGKLYLLLQYVDNNIYSLLESVTRDWEHQKRNLNVFRTQDDESEPSPSVSPPPLSS